MGSFGFWRQHIPHSSFGSYSGTFIEWPKELHDTIVLRASLANRNAVWSLWQAPIGELQSRPFIFWSKAHHPLHITTLLLRKMPQPATGPYGDWMLNHWPPSYQAPCVLPDPASSKVGGTQKYNIIKWKALNTTKLYEKGPNAHCPHSRYVTSSLPACTCDFLRSFLWTVGRGREHPGLFCRWRCMICRHHLKEGYSSTAMPFWDIPQVGGQGKSFQ